MRTAAFTALLCLALPAAAAPAANDAAVVAASKLAEKPNYSWSTVISNGQNNGEVHLEGQTTRGGYTHVALHNLPEVLRSRGVGRDAEGQSHVFFRGGDRSVLLTEEGWLAPEELPPAQASAARAPARGGARGPAPSSIPGKIEDYTFDFRLPHEDLDLIIGSFTSMRAAGNSFTGDLTDGGAALFLSFYAQPRVQVRRATGTFQCWTENGVVVRYEVHINGTVNLVGDRNALPINCTISTEIQNIGNTRLNVPAAVRVKLGG